MPRRLVLSLDAVERETLAQMRDHHPLPYLRERATALLRIADQNSARQIAATGLYKHRDYRALCSWVHRYQQEGLAGLVIRAGRGRKPAFSPHYPDASSAQAALLAVLQHDPRQLGYRASRWRLKLLRQACSWLRLTTDGGVSRLLQRLHITWKRGRLRLFSPDPLYLLKVRDVQVRVQQVWRPTATEVLLFEDEMSFYRQPTVANAYALGGASQQSAPLSYHSNSAYRIAGTLDAHSGRVLSLQRSHITLATLVSFYKQVCAAYPAASVIYLAQDNWPVHFHPDVLAALQPQRYPWPWHVPANWPRTPSAQARHLNLPVQLLPLPTYAPWTNPIEKLWRWLRQEVFHLHPYADRWGALKRLVSSFLGQFAQGSQALLRYVGLTTASRLYGTAISGVLPPVTLMRLNC